MSMLPKDAPMLPSDPALIPEPLPAPPLPATAWEILEYLLCALPQGRDATAKVRLLLQAVRAATGADVVYWYPGHTRAPLQSAGNRRLPLEWCQALVEQQTATAPAVRSHLTRTCLLASPGQRTPAPQSVALVRVSRSRSVWLVALSFNPTHLFAETDVQVMSLARRFFLQDRQRVRSQEKLKGTLFGLVSSLTAAISAKHPYTSYHSERVARIAARLGREMRLSPETQSNLYLAGLLHDVGKIGIDDSVLSHPGALSAEQRAQIEKHPVIGEQILAGVPSLAHLRPAVRHHHEHFDGRGYPDGLSSGAIPLLARILAVADSCDAMFSARPYRPGMPAERVDSILSGGAGSQWDPDVIASFMACRRELYAIYQKGLGDSMRRAVSDVVRLWDAE
jgi:HD-GYP domain-containing protein (c-di-GMP phosphodiesterase class II)